MPGKKYYFWRNFTVRRIRWARIWLVILFSIFTARLVYMQMIRGGYYWKRAEENRIQYFHLRAPRGRIFDRNGKELAGNKPSYSLFISPKGMKKESKKAVAEKLEEILSRDQAPISKNLNSGEQLPFGEINILSYLSREEIAKIEENMHYLPNTSIQVEPMRKYVYGANGAHFLGYIGEISKRELQSMRKFGYRLRDKIGKSGLEKRFDRELRGENGYQQLEVEVSGSQRRIIETKFPKIGNDLLLTIDLALQETAYKAMEGKAGAVVAMNPMTGEILTWLSQPGFNPEYFTMPMTSDMAKEMFSDPLHPLFDRVIQGQYAPGSIFKIVTSIAALETDPENINRKFTCNRAISIGYDKRIFRCWKEKRHGELELLDAIANSCNVYFYQLGMHIGHKVIHDTARKMGMGMTAQGIFDGERPGVIPDNKWKKDNIGYGWYPGDTANMSVGQGYVLVNPMQLLRLVSLIGARGKVFSPYLVKMVISPEGELKKKYVPELKEKIDISPDIFENVIDGMKRVAEYGTAQYLNVEMDVAAKTGTAQSPDGEDHAWFACFAPASRPEIAIVVLVEHGGYGSTAAMPVARMMLKEKFKIR